MKLRQAFRLLLPLIAVVGLALTPATVPAFAGIMAASVTSPEEHHVGMAWDAVADVDDVGMADMPCCPPADPAMPDCQKGCPLAALCLAKVVSGLPFATALPVRHAAIRSRVAWGVEASFASVAPRPPPEPPRD